MISNSKEDRDDYRDIISMNSLALACTMYAVFSTWQDSPAVTFAHLLGEMRRYIGVENSTRTDKIIHMNAVREVRTGPEGW